MVWKKEERGKRHVHLSLTTWGGGDVDESGGERKIERDQLSNRQ